MPQSSLLLISMVTELVGFQLTIPTVAFTALATFNFFPTMNLKVLQEVILSFEYFFTDLTGMHITQCVSDLSDDMLYTSQCWMKLGVI